MNNPEAGPEKAAPTLPAAGSPYAVLRNRDFLLYLTSRFIASLAQQMLIVAVGWEIYERTHAVMPLGIVGLVQMIPMFLFTFPAGHVADNYDRKFVLSWSQFALAVTCAALAFTSHKNASVAWTYACLFAMGTVRTYLWSASASYMPQLVPRELFARAVAWNTGSFQIAAVVGPAAGGLVIWLMHSAVAVYVLNAVAGVVCFLLIMAIKGRPVVLDRQPISLKNIVAGLKFIWHTKIILGCITLDMFAVLLGGATSMLPVYTKDILHSDSRGLGLLQAALPLGSLLMALVMVHRPPMQKAGRALLWAVVVFGLATIGFGVSKFFWVSFAMLFLCGASDYISVVVRHTLVQLLTPDEMRGRVSAVNGLFIGTSNQLGEFESAAVASFTNPVFSVVAGGIGTILVVIGAAYIWPEIRKYGRLDT